MAHLLPSFLIAALLALARAGGGVQELQRPPDHPQEVFARAAIAAAAEPGALDAAVRAAPFRAVTFVHDLLRQAAFDVRATWSLDTASAVAAAHARATGTRSLVEAVERAAGWGDEGRAARADCERAFQAAVAAAARGDFEGARAGLGPALAYARGAPEPYQAARALRLLGQLALELGRTDVARAELEEARAIDTQLGDDAALVRDDVLLGDLERLAGRPHAAFERHARACELARRAGEPVPVDALALARLAARIGRHAEARAALDQVLAEARSAGDTTRAAEALEVAGTLESAHGDYARAIVELEAATAARRRSGAAEAAAGAEVLLAGVLAEIGRLEEAGALLGRALAALDGDHAGFLRAHAELALAIVRIDGGDPDAALPLLERAGAVFAAAGQASGAADALEQRARAESVRGRPAEAAALWREVVERRAALGQPFQSALAWTGLGDALLAAGDPDGAERAFERALDAGTPLASAEATWRARWGRARAHASRGERERALDELEAALADVERLRDALGPALGGRLVSERAALYRDAVRAAVAAGDLARGFRWSEATKALVLLDQDRRSARGGAGGAPDGAGAALARAEADLVLLERRRREALESGADADELARRDADLAAARAERARADVAFEAAHAVASRLGGRSAPAPLEAVQAALGPAEALVEYVVGPEGALAWVLRRETARCVVLDGGEREFAELVERLERPVRELERGRIDLAHLAFDAAASEELHARLLRPLSADLRGIGRLYVVPDGVLWRVPFAALVTVRAKRPIDPARHHAQHAGHRFLVEDVALATLPIAALLAAEPPSAPPGRGALVVADPDPLPARLPPLAGARAEAEAVARILPSPARLLGEDATESAVQERLSGARWLHFAVHGFLDERDPSAARLALGRGPAPPAEPGRADGWLHAFELRTSSLEGAHVVLSGCRTAGPVVRGEGRLGLARAFLSAGAQSVVAASWAVDDEATRALMERYWQALVADPAHAIEALRAAQVGLLREGSRPGMAYVHPFFWAGFVHYGAR